MRWNLKFFKNRKLNAITLNLFIGYFAWTSKGLTSSFVLFTLAVFCFVEDCVVYLWIAEHLRFPSNTWYKWSHFDSATQLIRCGVKSWYRILPVVISKNIINLHPRKSLGFSSLWWPMNLYTLWSLYLNLLQCILSQVQIKLTEILIGAYVWSLEILIRAPYHFGDL